MIFLEDSKQAVLGEARRDKFCSTSMASAPEPPWTRLVREYETTRSFKMMGAIRAARDHLDGQEAAETCGDTQEHPTLSSDFVRACLRAKMYDVRKAVDLVHSYQRFRRKSGWHTASGEKNVTAAATSSTLLSGFNLVLPSADVNGHVVLTQQMGLIFGDSSSSEGGARAGGAHQGEAAEGGVEGVLDVYRDYVENE